MSPKTLPGLLKPSSFAEVGQRYETELPMVSMPRLVSIVGEQEGKVRAYIESMLNQQGRPCISGKVSAELVFECQRCLGQFSQIVEKSFSLLVAGEGAVSDVEVVVLDDSPDILIMEIEDTVEPLKLLEEELLLVLPDFSMHERVEDCDPDMIRRATEYGAGAVEGKHNPFAVLKKFKLSE